MNMTIKFAKTREEREAIYQLCYEVYIEEFQFLNGVDRGIQQQSIESSGEGTLLLYAAIDGEVVGCIRLHTGFDAPFSEELVSTYNLNRFRGILDDAQMLVASRFIVKKEHRGSSVTLRLMKRIAQYNVDNNIEIMFIDSEIHKVRLYERIGFRSYAGDIFNHPHASVFMVPLAVVTGDIAYVKKYARWMGAILEERTRDPQLVQRCIDALGEPQVKKISNLPEQYHEALMLTLQHKVPIFHKVNASNVASIADQGFLLNLEYGHQLLLKGALSQAVYVLLSGTLELRNGTSSQYLTESGSMVGDVVLLSDDEQPHDVFVGMSGASVLAFEVTTLNKSLASSGAQAARMLLNLEAAVHNKLQETTSQPAEAPLPVLCTAGPKLPIQSGITRVV